jgi:hypothetical protein
MSKVIIFSRTFPAYHPKAGQPTYFVEKMWNDFEKRGIEINYKLICDLNLDKDVKILWDFWVDIDRELAYKHHTIRAGNRWKVGDKFSPRVWSGKPYNSKQIIIAPDIEIKKVWDFEMDLNGLYSINGKYFSDSRLLAKNDGLSRMDLFYWLMKSFDNPKPFKGQIICWNENINY